jgi:Rhodopirellula transposase DDE domain
MRQDYYCRFRRQQRCAGQVVEMGVAAASRRNRAGVSVGHFPPGTSKWNKIEHRLFSFISQNWRGKPLISHEVIINLIAATTSKTGLAVKSDLDSNIYPAGIKVSDRQMAELRLRRDAFHGDWNYSLLPRG